MPRKHFHTIDIAVGETERKRTAGEGPVIGRHDWFMAPHNMVLHARGLRAWISVALMQAKVETFDPRVTQLNITLTDTPRDLPEYYRKGERWDLMVDLPSTAQDVADLPMDNALRGEFFIGVVERAMEKAADYIELPRDVVAQGCAVFRKRNYTYPYDIGESIIDGTKVNGRLRARASCIGTTRHFSAHYRRKLLFEAEIPGVAETHLDLRRSFGGFVWKDDVIIVKEPHWWAEFVEFHDTDDYAKRYEIDLSAFPDARDFIRTKLVSGG